MHIFSNKSNCMKRFCNVNTIEFLKTNFVLCISWFPGVLESYVSNEVSEKTRYWEYFTFNSSKKKRTKFFKKVQKDIHNFKKKLSESYFRHKKITKGRNSGILRKKQFWEIITHLSECSKLLDVILIDKHILH